MNKIFNSKLLQKNQINKNCYELFYTLALEFTFTPGQFVVLRFNSTYARAYSIVEVKNNVLKLLVDVKPMGLASKYFVDTKVNDEIQILGPYGVFGIKNILENKVFVATGSGIAPFIPMIYSLVNNSEFKGNIYLFFGTKTNDLDIAYRYFKDISDSRFKYIQCITREEIANSYSFKGRVNILLEELINKSNDKLNVYLNNLELNTSEIYICGGVEMITDTVNTLKKYNIKNIFMEKYS